MSIEEKDLSFKKDWDCPEIPEAFRDDNSNQTVNEDAPVLTIKEDLSTEFRRMKGRNALLHVVPQIYNPVFINASFN